MHTRRFRHLGELDDLNQAIKYQTQAVLLTPDGHADLPEWLDTLGGSYQNRFKHLGEVDDIDRAIRYQTQAVSITSDEDPNKLAVLNNLGSSFRIRFECLGQVDNIDQAIIYQTKAVSLAPDGRTERPILLNNLGLSYQTRFERLDEYNDIEKAILYKSQAAVLTPDEHPDKPLFLDNLGSGHRARFERLGELQDIDRAIEFQRKAELLTPEGHADKSIRLNNLGSSHYSRFQSLGDIADIDHAIKYQKQAVALMHHNHTFKSKMINGLGCSYQSRFERLGELDDINEAIDHQVQAVSLTPDDYMDKPAWLNNLGISYRGRFEYLGALDDIDLSIKYQLQAVSLVPHDSAHKATFLNNLSASYVARFERLGEINDIDQAITYQLQALSLTKDNKSNKPMLLNNLGSSYQNRFTRLAELDDIDQAINYHTQAVLLTADNHADKPRLLNNLGTSHLTRLERLGALEDIDCAVKYLAQAVSLAPGDYAEKPTMLHNLACAHKARFELVDEADDLKQAIMYEAQAVLLIPDNHMDKPSSLHNLGMLYRARFQRFNELGDLSKSICHQKEAVLMTPDSHVRKPEWLSSLGVSYHIRFQREGRPVDMQHCANFLAESAYSQSGHPLVKLRASVNWARVSFEHALGSQIEAYDRAMAFVPQVIWLGIAVSNRYERIKSDIEGLAVEAAHVAISIQDYPKALQWLEDGRSIVWNQQLRLRTSVEELAKVSPDLAERLATVSRELEDLSQPSSGHIVLSSSAPSIEQVSQRHRRVAQNWEDLLTEIRSLPALGNFLQPNIFERLPIPVESSAIVVINASRVSSQCDALAIIPGSASCKHIELPQMSYDKAENIRKRLSLSDRASHVRTHNTRHPVYQRYDVQEGIEFVLASLWTDIVCPVLDGIGYLVPASFEGELPRVTWCTTGPFAFLPLHAAGDYSKPGKRAFDYVVSSYTPTISALLRPTPTVTDFKGMIAVGQANASGSAPLPGTVKETDIVQDSRIWERFTRLEGENATVKQVLRGMETHSWVHLACHASQSLTDPLKSAFKLYDGNLSLADVMKKPLGHADFAFLSACETATGDESLPDEAIHLAAGMLMAGYSSVVATMWSIYDEDAPLVSKELYAYMLAGDVLNGRRAARGLHRAIGKLRATVGEREFERWVPYIHMGH
ncbi:CHAT domain protein [Ceratobasidium sp. AG-Ba]|nr:CHAT domain protein [Ceratobasidium sp. AG-Ba]